MATEAWKGFVHSWHNLAMVLKYMCMSVIGIPFAFATCLLIALCAIIFGLLCIGAAAGACALVYYSFKRIWWTIRQIPYWAGDVKDYWEMRKIMRLPVANARGRRLEQWNGKVRCPQTPVQMVPSGYMPGPSDIQPPPRAYLPPSSRKAAAAPGTDLPDMIECQVCLEEKTANDYPARAPTSECEHEAATCCTSCLVQTIVSAFESNMWDDIRCPICNLQFQHSDVAEFAPPDIFEKYNSKSVYHEALH